MKLTRTEVEALLAAAGNADPAMWEDYETEAEGERMYAAWLSGQEKLRQMLAQKKAP
jgi:hypothetical protein